jgi:hypothetical protein
VFFHITLFEGARGVPASLGLGRCSKYWPKTTESACVPIETLPTVASLLRPPVTIIVA